MYLNIVIATIFPMVFILGLNGMYPSGSTGVHLNDGSSQAISTAQCPNVSSSDFTTLGPPDIPHKIRVIYAYADEFPVVSWESNDTNTTILDQDIGDWGAYFQENGYDFIDIKLTVSDG